jgi:hypothetical protein
MNIEDNGAAQPYIIMGHGIEELDNANNNAATRIKVPRGVTVVTMAQCGDSTYEEEVARFIHLFMDKDPKTKKMLSEPTSHLRELEWRSDKQLHIYKTGDLMPRFAVMYFAKMPEKIYKSGVYAYPIEKDDLLADNDQDITEPFPPFVMKQKGFSSSHKISDTLLEKIYKGSVYPSLDLDGRKTYKSFMSSVTHRFDDIFSSLPKPAVYYYVICRTPFKATGRTIYGREPLMGEFLPAAVDVDNTIKLLDLDMDFIKEEKEKDDSMYGGLDIVDYMKEHMSVVPDELKELFTYIKPKKTRNTLELYKDIDEKVKRLHAFNASVIKDMELSSLFKEYRNNFKGWRYTNVSEWIPRIERRRRYSLKQQEKYRPKKGGARGGTRRRR